jgi:hypothetical protein
MSVVELYYREGSKKFTIPNPTKEEVIQAIAGLDGRSRTIVQLYLTDGILGIGGGNQDKVTVDIYYYRRPESPRRPGGWLADPKFANDEREIPMLLDDVYDEVSFELAIDKNMAIQVALYYMGENPFPESVSWIWGR